MTQDDLYPYADGDKLERPNTYFYTPYHGSRFLDAWLASRGAALAELPAPVAPARPQTRLPENPPYGLRDLTAGVLAVVGHAGTDAEAQALQLLAGLTRRYEVTKRLHESYSAEFRPIGPTCPPQDYVGFAEALTCAYRRTEALPYLNALLKVVDALLSIRRTLPASVGPRLAGLILAEREAVRELAGRHSLCLGQ